MDVAWDHTVLADAYLARPTCAKSALERIFINAGLKNGDRVCDIGAGVAHMTLPLLEAGFIVDAVEPNDAMRANGILRTKGMPGVTWSDGTGENTGCSSGVYDFVCFVSSFNVCDRELALKETYRLLKPQNGFAACGTTVFLRILFRLALRNLLLLQSLAMIMASAAKINRILSWRRDYFPMYSESRARSFILRILELWWMRGALTPHYSVRQGRSFRKRYEI